MSDSHPPAPDNDPDSQQPPDYEDLLRAQEGDEDALARVRRKTRARLQPRIAAICARLCGHGCLKEVLAFGVPSSAAELTRVMLSAADDAIFGWDRKEIWREFVLRIAVTKGWGQVARFFKDSAIAIVEEALDALGFPPGIRNPLAGRIPAIVERILKEAPQKWLIDSHSQTDWQTFVLPEAHSGLIAELGKFARDGEQWPIDADLDARIVALASRLAASRRGGALSPLADELANAARAWVALLARSCGPNRRPSNAYLFVVGKNMMKTMLSITRSHNFGLMVWLIDDARMMLRQRLGQEPTNDEIARELNPDWAEGRRDNPTFSLSLIANVRALFPVESAGDGGELRASRLAFVLERLAVRARLTEEQAAVLKLFAAGMSHEAIAMKLGITILRSRKLHHQAKLRIIVAARKLSAHEWTVLNLKLAEGKSYLQVAVKLGISESDTKVLFHFAAEMIEMFPRLLLKLTQAERRALELGLFGSTQADIAARLGLSREIVGHLLKMGIAKIPHLSNDK